MDDMIRRDAAIEYLMTNMGWRDEDGYEVDDADEKRAIIKDLLNGVPAVDAAPVVRCADCVHCCDLKDVGPMEPYSGDGDGSFFCDCFDMDFYAPRYRAETYFCADGERRKEE